VPTNHRSARRSRLRHDAAPESALSHESGSVRLLLVSCDKELVSRALDGLRAKERAEDPETPERGGVVLEEEILVLHGILRQIVELHRPGSTVLDHLETVSVDEALLETSFATIGLVKLGDWPGDRVAATVAM